MSGTATYTAATRSAKVRVITDLDSIESIRSVWRNQRIDDIDADPEFYSAVVRSSAGVSQPHIIFIDRAAGSPLFAIARIDTKRRPIALGYRRLFSPRIRTLVVCFGGLLGDVDESAAAQLLDELERPLRDGRADVLLIPKLNTMSPLHKVARRSVPIYRRGRSTQSARWVARVPETMEGFLAGRSRKTRQTYRRQDRRLEEKFGSRLRVEAHAKGCDVDRMIDDLRNVALKTYQHGLGVSLSDSELEIALIKDGLAQGWFRVWILYIDDRPVAFWSGTTYRGVFATGTPGFDPEYARESVGRYTMFKMIADLCRDSDVRLLDFGHGAAEYKEAFGEQARSEVDLIVYAPRIRSLLINSAASAADYLNGFGRTLVSRHAWARELKRRSRASRADTLAFTRPV